MSTIYNQLNRIAARYDKLEQLMATPDVLADFSRLNELAQERNETAELVWRRPAFPNSGKATRRE